MIGCHCLCTGANSANVIDSILGTNSSLGIDSIWEPIPCDSDSGSFGYDSNSGSGSRKKWNQNTTIVTIEYWAPYRATVCDCACVPDGNLGLKEKLRANLQLLSLHTCELAAVQPGSGTFIVLTIDSYAPTRARRKRKAKTSPGGKETSSSSA